ncbi:hypothetical protein IscW_ISCW016282 [Ixodes scapularis]|uniref:Uncharacterized protein n=1 Tax=Ixodes scapularis TaxID=6945 RepID=B7P222_IXOSC|nr:hypothetical protein IscW_ISCW016282 [Ixodes scapularis]|eukprot:XP_002401345.1 hypothetical protein IscW_ISCW016282 [Ixodes scapularis]
MPHVSDGFVSFLVCAQLPQPLPFRILVVIVFFRVLAHEGSMPRGCRSTGLWLLAWLFKIKPLKSTCRFTCTWLRVVKVRNNKRRWCPTFGKLSTGYVGHTSAFTLVYSAAATSNSCCTVPYIVNLLPQVLLTVQWVHSAMKHTSCRSFLRIRVFSGGARVH